MDQNLLEGEFLLTKEFCQVLEKRGLLHVLSSGEPEQIGEKPQHRLPVFLEELQKREVVTFKLDKVVERGIETLLNDRGGHCTHSVRAALSVSMSITL